MKGIRIEDILQSSRLSLLSVDEKMPFDRWLACPSCEKRLRLICRLIDASDRQVRVGLCENCGYIGYMDRPTKIWMDDFYSREWDKTFPRTLAEIQKGTVLPSKGIKPSRYLAASLVEKIKPDKEKPVCEIGSGYGEVLKYFRDSGFKDIIGVENSKHRAELVREALGFNILHGGFEDENVQRHLIEQKPFGLIFSHHVLEHTYDPAEVVKRISYLQDEGDFLILALPNSAGEHINYALLYLVHLHSFTKESLEALLNKNGYEIIADNSPDDSNTIIAARKTSDPKPRFQIKKNYFNSVSKRIRKGLAFDEIKKPIWYSLYWEQNSERDKSEVKELGSSFLVKLIWYLRNKSAYIRSRFFRRFTSGHTILVYLEEASGDYFEVRFPDKITFLVK